VSDADLCIVFGNCVENAIEACQRAGGERFIRIKSIIIGDMLAVTIDNSFDGILNQNNNTYQSRKHNGEGIGISSVKAVARKYGGDAKFESKANVFQASVILRVKD
jgi:sensor histidine kinase YesM